MKTRKKWLRKTTAICTAALLGTAAIPSTAFAADSYASIEKDAWAKKVTEMASSYATSIEESQSLMSGMQSDMILKFEDSGRSLLGFVAPFDVSWLDNVTLSNDISFTEGKEGILMKVLLNDNKICTLEYYLDPDSQDIYMRIPELSDKYFKTNLEEAADQQAANIENDLEELTPDDSDADIPTDNFASAYSDSLSLTVSIDHSIITHRSTRLRNILHATLMSTLNIITEWEECIRSQCNIRHLIQPCTFLFFCKYFRFLCESFLPHTISKYIHIFIPDININGIVTFRT